MREGKHPTPHGIDSTDPRDVVCLSGVFRVCEVADKKTIKHDKPRNINEYSRCIPGKILKDLCSLAFSSRYYPINPYKPIHPDMFVLSGQFADVGRTLGLHCRCLRMFPGRVTLSTDVPSLFADVLTKPADLAIGDHRAPQSGQCKPRFTAHAHSYTAGGPTRLQTRENWIQSQVGRKSVFKLVCQSYLARHHLWELGTVVHRSQVGRQSSQVGRGWFTSP